MTSPLSQLRVTLAPLMLLPVMLVFAMWFVFTDDRFATPEDVGFYGLAAVIAASVLLTELIGFRSPPLPMNLAPAEAGTRGVALFRAGAFVRLAMAELPVLLSVVMTFLATPPHQGLVLVIIGAVATEALMVWQVLPSDRHIEKVQARLEADGARVPLREALSVDPLR